MRTGRGSQAQQGGEAHARAECVREGTHGDPRKDGAAHAGDVGAADAGLGQVDVLPDDCAQ